MPLVMLRAEKSKSTLEEAAFAGLRKEYSMSEGKEKRCSFKSCTLTPRLRPFKQADRKGELQNSKAAFPSIQMIQLEIAKLLHS